MSARCALLIAGLLFAGAATAGDADHVAASRGWIRVMPGALPAGGYVVLENRGDHAASLSSASSPAYAEVMLHKSSTDTGMGRMEHVDALPIPAHGKAALSPGGYHLMLMKANAPVKVGDKVRVTLHFTDGSTLDTEFEAKPANTVDGGDMGGMEHRH
ncbi:copper chaperone PCu(A)C [Dyella sp. 2RAB6]|uniref:copper chaperone PCu(A)C n=1 Tax=Dyella sp. 2RAB6 TaxID=3232992 RepID=UPI003F8F41C7